MAAQSLADIFEDPTSKSVLKVISIQDLVLVKSLGMYAQFLEGRLEDVTLNSGGSNIVVVEKVGLI